MNAFDDISAELFARRYHVRFRAGGGSMYPAIRDGETITVEPAPSSALAVGDIAFYRTRRGVTAHRVVATAGTGTAFLMRGDAPGSEIEAVEPDWILGKVVAIERGGRSIDPVSRKTKMTNFMLQSASRARRRVLVMASYLLASLALLLVLSAPAHGAVAIVTSTGVGFSQATPYPWTPFSTGSGYCSTSNYLMVAVTSHHATVTGVTYGTPARTLASMGLPAPSGAGDVYVQVFYGPMLSSDCGTTMTFTLSGASTGTPSYAAAIVFSGTRGPGAAPTPVSAPNSTGTAAPYLPNVTLNVTTPGLDGLVLGVLGVDSGNDAVTEYNGQTVLWHQLVTASSGDRTLTAHGTSLPGVASGTITMHESWTNSTSPAKDGAYYYALIPMYSGSPTLAKERSFTATPSAEGTLIEFSTSYEVSSLGFNLYKEQNGRRVKLNESLLAGSALFAGPGTAFTAGRSHSWLDQSAGGSASYWIEEVDINGERTWFGPAAVQTAVTRGAARLAPAVSVQSQSLSQVGREDVLAAVPAADRLHTLEPFAQTSSDRASAENQWSIAAGQAVKIAVRSEGWYRVSQADLLAAGLDPRVDPRTLQLYADGSEQPIIVQGESDGKLNAGDSVEFYGVGMNTTWSGVHTYWLRAGSTSGLRVKSLTGKPLMAVGMTSFPFTIQWKPRTVYFAALLNGDSDNFFGPVLAAEPVSQSLTVSQYATGGGNAQLNVTLQGATSGSHQVAVQINGTQIGQVNFSGVAPGTVSLTVPKALLKSGANILTLTAMGGESDVSVVDAVLLTYPRTYVAEGDALRCTVAAGAPATITDFSSSQIRVMDVTDPGNVTALTGTVSRRTDGSYAIALIAPGSGTRTLLAFVNPAVVSSADVTANSPSSWHASGPGADMVIVGNALFLSALTPLQTLRQSQGLRVALVDVQDLYDEFNYGAKSPYALKNFLLSAEANWQSKPRFMLLVGDASYDPRGYLAGDLDFVPTKLVDTAYLQTASDDWYADFQGNGLPQLAVGRLPVQTLAEAQAAVSRIVAYEGSRGAGWRNQVVLVAGQNDNDNNFESQTGTVKAALPGYLPVTTIDQGSSSNANGDLVNALQAGAGLVNYIGHGSVGIWAGGLLNSTQAASLTNSPYLPFFVSMTCLNGYFIDSVNEPSLARELIMAPAGGAIAVWASSGLSGSASETPLDVALIKALYSTAVSTTIGEAAAAAKKAVTDLDIRQTWVLLGDPATRLR